MIAHLVTVKKVRDVNILTLSFYILIFNTQIEVEEQVPEPTAAMPMMSAATTGGWEDPTEVNWGEEEEEEKDEQPIAPEPKEVIFKCTALYSYTVSARIES